MLSHAVFMSITNLDTFQSSGRSTIVGYGMVWYHTLHFLSRYPGAVWYHTALVAALIVTIIPSAVCRNSRDAGDVVNFIK